MQPAIHAHRGSRDPVHGVVENTLGAFARARDLGADGVELDVRLTVDGALAVHHDPIVPGIGPVAELTVRELPPDVPLLDAAIDACDGMAVNIEVKNLPTEPWFDPDEQAARAVGSLLAGCDTGGARPGSLLVSSFWPPSLEAVLDVVPAAATGLLVAGWADPDVGLTLASNLGCRALHPEQSLVTPHLVEACHQAGLAVTVWTVNDAESLERLADWSVDHVITDDVVLATAVLRADPTLV